MPHPRSDGASPTAATATTRPHRIRRPSYKLREIDRSGYDPRRRIQTALERRQRRATRVEVLVPTLRQIDARLGHRNRSRNGDRSTRARSHFKSEEQEVKFHFLLQARIKSEVKREEISFENIVRDRLACIGPETFVLDVPGPLLEATATRMFMARTWGGTPSKMFPLIGKQFTHGLDDFMYINHTYDQYAPRWPGAPGLFFMPGENDSDGKGCQWPKIMRVLVRLESNNWQYMGQYALTAALPLTLDEWNAQSYQAKRTLATRLLERDSADNKRFQTRIALRKLLGRKPTSQELATTVRPKENFRASPDDIFREYNEGNVVIRVWCMKCVGYDVDFQRRIATGSRNLE